MGRNQADVSIWIRAKDLTGQALRGVRGGVTRVKNAIFSLRTGIIALGAAVVIRGIQKLTQVFGVQQDAIIQLNSTLRNTGRFSE